MKPRSRDAVSLLQGTVDLLILRAIQHEPAHGYAISRRVRERTDGVLAIEDAALYQALHRLEAREWIEADWGLSENNRRAKYYSLTAEGRRQLKAEVTSWKRYAQAVFKLIETRRRNIAETSNSPAVPFLVADEDRHPYRHSRRVPLSSRHADRGSDARRPHREPGPPRGSTRVRRCCRGRTPAGGSRRHDRGAAVAGADRVGAETGRRLRLAPHRPQSGILRRRDRDARGCDRRQYRHLQRRQRAALQAGAVCRPHELARIHPGESQMSWLNYQDIRARSRSFTDMAAHAGR